VDVLQFLGVVNGGAFQSPIFENYGKLLADRRFHPAGFALRLGLKDTELALDAAKAGPAPLPIASLLRDRYLEALALGQGELDWCAIADLSRLHANVTHSEKAGG
jgi:3-hydroxyisobutyrate dehydrogenase-like beta-hydroxyacid dehydrogenase